MDCMTRLTALLLLFATFSCEASANTGAECISITSESKCGSAQACVWVTEADAAWCRRQRNKSVCPSVCSRLPHMATRSTWSEAPSRYPQSMKTKFVDSMLNTTAAGLAQFQGADITATWVPMNGFVAAMLTFYQRQWSVLGAVGEIGVHWGDYFLPIAITARMDEQLWVLDVFEQQEKNVDASGLGDYNIFMRRCSTLGLSEANMTVSKMASDEMSVQQLCQLVPQRFRFLSIDGGHTRDIVYSDLNFAECQLADGGIAAMDDYSHPYWPGVHEGIVHYFKDHPHSRLAPFLLSNNKLYLTTKNYHAQFLDAMMKEPFWKDGCKQEVCIEAPGKNGGSFAKFQLAGYGIAVTEWHTFDMKVAHRMWTEWLSLS